MSPVERNEEEAASGVDTASEEAAIGEEKIDEEHSFVALALAGCDDGDRGDVGQQNEAAIGEEATASDDKMPALVASALAGCDDGDWGNIGQTTEAPIGEEHAFVALALAGCDDGDWGNVGQYASPPPPPHLQHHGGDDDGQRAAANGWTTNSSANQYASPPPPHFQHHGGGGQRGRSDWAPRSYDNQQPLPRQRVPSFNGSRGSNHSNGMRHKGGRRHHHLNASNEAAAVDNYRAPPHNYESKAANAFASSPFSRQHEQLEWKTTQPHNTLPSAPNMCLLGRRTVSETIDETFVFVDSRFL